jgi:hypothetical protein
MERWSSLADFCSIRSSYLPAQKLPGELMPE